MLKKQLYLLTQGDSMLPFANRMAAIKEDLAMQGG